MKIAVNQVRGNSGVDVWAGNFCRGLQQAGHGCSVNLYSLAYQFLPALARLHPVSSGYDLIQSNTWNGFAFKGDAPLVVTEHLVVHDPAFDPYRAGLQKFYHHWIRHCETMSLDLSDAVVCVSEDTRQKLVDVFGYSDAKVIYNGVDASIFRPEENTKTVRKLPENKVVLLFTGNLSRRKGADLLPAIMKQLGDDYLLLTTSGNRNKSQNNIPYSRDLGHLSLEQLIDAYNHCDLFILPSRLEGLSFSALEAMACAKPVIAFNCSSFPELIVEGKGGFLPEKDNVNMFADRIQYLANEPDLKKKMGQFNRERILNKFTLDAMVKNYIHLYQSF